MRTEEPPLRRRLHHRLRRYGRAHPRLFIAIGLALLLWALLPSPLFEPAGTRALIAWNFGTTLYVGLAAVMMWRSDEASLRRRALLQDEGRVAMLGLTVIATLASLAAIAAELAYARELHGADKLLHVTLAGYTVLASWAFVQTMFALHYAHEFYGGAGQPRAGGLDFPDDDAPRYGDFFYVSAVIGTSGQTADVAFTSKALRRVGTMHCILAYLYNTTVLALLINIAAGLL